MEWLSFPGLFKYLTFLGVIAYVCQWANPQIGQLLEFDRARILEHKEIWRIFSFVFAPIEVGFSPVMGVLFLFFAVMISFLISDSLEHAWGPTRTTLYIVVAVVGMAACQFVMNDPRVQGGGLLYTSLFFAFSTLFPKVEFMLFFLIPVQVRFLAILAAVMLAISTFASPQLLWLVVPAMLPYALWVLPNVISGRKTLVTAAVRRRDFTVAKGPEGVPFHVCEVCGRTERDPADLEFFVTADGKEYCSEHLPPQP